MARVDSFYTLATVIACLAILAPTNTEGSSYCERCMQDYNFYTTHGQGCKDRCSQSLIGKRTVPGYSNFGAFIQDQMKTRKALAASASDYCELMDIYRAVPTACYPKLDWMVNKIEKSLVTDE